MPETPPATTLSTLTTRLLLLLGDTSANRFTDEITEEAWKLALAEYSYAVPNIQTKTFTITQAGREQVLPVTGEPEEDTDLFPGLIAITQVLYPWLGDIDAPGAPGGVEQDPLQRYYFYFADGQPVLYFGGTRTPAVGEQIRISYASAHTIDDLNEADTCTVPSQDFELLLLGAAGHAARLRTSIYAESFSNHPELKLFAIDNLKQYRDTLRAMRRQSSRQPLPAVGFKLDAWDGA
jgi:hypothetical protein